MDQDPALVAVVTATLRADQISEDTGSALEALYQTHFRKFEKYFRLAMRGCVDASDLVHETFARALKAHAQFRGQSKLSTWVWSIARNVLLENLRARRPDLLSDSDEETLAGLTAPFNVRQTEQDDCVRRGFERFFLDDPHRAHVVYLAYVEGLTREELAAELGRTVRATTEYLYQCKKKFRSYIEGCHDC